MQEKLKHKIGIISIIIIIFWFIFLCLLNYFAQKPRMDEGEILNNIKELSISQLFGELKYNQVFPRAYLALISIFSSHFSYNMLSLRFFPLLFMVGGFLLWVYLYKQESRTNFMYFLLMFSFASSIFMIDYAAYLKQYSCDLFVIAVFTAFIYQQKRYFENKFSTRNLWIFSVFAPILVLFSQMSFLAFWIIIYNYLFLMKKDAGVRFLFAVYVLFTIIFCLLVYRFDLCYSRKIAFMQEYWNSCFIDTSSLYNFSKTFTNGLQNLITRWFFENKTTKSIATVFMPFCLVAICRSFWISINENKGKILDINSLCLVLLIELFILGIFRIYPFTGSRITLFIAPFMLYMIVKGIYLTKKIKILFFPLLSFYMGFLCWVSYSLLFFYLSFYKK